MRGPILPGLSITCRPAHVLPYANLALSACLEAIGVQDGTFDHYFLKLCVTYQVPCGSGYNAIQINLGLPGCVQRFPSPWAASLWRRRAKLRMNCL
jgi:hypothetical protein